MEQQTTSVVPNPRGTMLLVTKPDEKDKKANDLWLPVGTQYDPQRGIVVKCGPEVDDADITPGTVVYFFNGTKLGDYQLVYINDILAWEEA
jgi:hypothetical protein